MLIKYLFPIVCIVFLKCGVYTFSGSTLPSYLKTVTIPLFINKSLQPEVAEYITSELSKKIEDDNILRPVSRDGDAIIEGKVLTYTNKPHIYDSKSFRDVDVSSYAVTISVEIEFMDNKKDKALYKGTVTEEGIYDFEKETEEDGRRRAIEKIINKILQKSIQSW